MWLLGALIVPLFAAAPGAHQFTSGVNLIEVYATVTDARGEPVTGLSASDFTVAEDGVPQTITAFAAGAFPLSLAIAIDRSFSMAGRKLSLAKSAARVLLDTLRPEDQVMVTAIGSEREEVSPLGGDRVAAARAIDALQQWGTTPLYDSIPVAIDAIAAGRGRRALVLLSDGADRGSEMREADVIAYARRKDVLIYPVAIESRRPAIFAELAAVTGARSVAGASEAELRTAMSAIARELRFQYLLGYAPAHQGADDRSWHAIEVTVARPDARVRARDGYFGR